jgi:outer membrane lipoprotein SlyB
MVTRYAQWTIGIAMATLMAGCVAPPPRPTTYYDDRGAYDQRAYDDRGGYYDRGRTCHECGQVSGVERVYARDRSTSGGGAVIGAIVGGLLGSTVGKGDGRTAATVAGAVAGGFAGNAVESNNNGRAYNAWRFYVQLDDGRNAVVTQYDNPGFREGDRVAIRNSHLVMMR